MKKCFVLFALIVLLVPSASGQIINKPFTLPNGDLSVRDTKFKRVYTPTPADAGWSVLSNAIYPTSSAGVGDTGAVYYDTTFNANARSFVIKFRIVTEGAATSTGQDLRVWICPETTYAGNGYLLRYNEQTGTDLFRAYEVTNGAMSATYFGGNYELLPNDTVNITVRGNNSTRPFLVGVGRTGGGNDSVISIDDATPKTLSAFRIRFEGFVKNTSVVIDDFTVDTLASSGGGGSGTDLTAPTVTSNSRNPSGAWSISTVGNFRAAVYDSGGSSTGLDSAYCYLSTDMSSYAEIYRRKCGTTRDTTFQTRDTTLTSGSYWWVWRFVDDAGNVRETAANNFTIGSTSQFARVIWYAPYYSEQVNIKGTNSSYGVNFLTDLPIDDITDFIWFCTYPTTNAAQYYCNARLGNPGSISNQNRDFVLETAYPNDPGAWDSRYGGPVAFRESLATKLHAKGKNLILDVGGAYGTGDAGWDFITGDSTICWTYCDSTARYAFVKGYDGLNQNWEFPNTAAAWQMGIRMLRRAVTKYWGPSGLLYITTYRSYTGISAYTGSIALLNDSVDLVIPMVYGMGEGSTVGHNAPLYIECGVNAIDNSSLKTWLAAGLDTSLLAPLYTFECKSRSGAYLCEPWSGSIFYATYNTIWTEMQTYPPSWDDVAKVPYLQYTSTAKQFRSFENAQSLAEKVSYTRNLNIPNIGIWDPNRGVVVSPLDGDHQPLATALFSAIGGIATTTPPAAPALFEPVNNATGLTRDGTVLSWHRSTGATTYWLQCSTDSSFVTNNVVNLNTLTDSTYMLPVLNYYTRYYWRVAAGNDGGWSSFTSTRNFRTESQIAAPPSAPTLVYPAANDTGIRPPIAFRWNRQDSVAYWTLSYTTDTTGASTSITPINDTTYSVAAQLTSGGYYFYRVTAYNAAGNASSSWRRFRAASQGGSVSFTRPWIGQRRPYGNRTEFWDYPSSIQMIHSTIAQAGRPDAPGMSLLVDGGGIDPPAFIPHTGDPVILGGLSSLSGQTVLNAFNTLGSATVIPYLTFNQKPGILNDDFLTEVDTLTGPVATKTDLRGTVRSTDAVINWNYGANLYFTDSISADRTYSFVNEPTNHGILRLYVTSLSGSPLVSFPSNISWTDTTQPQQSVAPWTTMYEIEKVFDTYRGYARNYYPAVYSPPPPPPPPPVGQDDTTGIFFNASTGSDVTGNGTYSRPYATLNVLNGMSTPRGTVAKLNRGDTFRTPLALTSAHTGLTITAYGTGADPKLSMWGVLPNSGASGSWARLSDTVYTMSGVHSISRLWVLPAGGDTTEFPPSQTTALDATRRWYRSGGTLYLYVPLNGGTTQNPTNAYSAIFTNSALSTSRTTTQYSAISVIGARAITFRHLNVEGAHTNVYIDNGDSLIFDSVRVGWLGHRGFFITNGSDSGIIRYSTLEKGDTFTSVRKIDGGGDGVAIYGGCDRWEIHHDTIRSWTHAGVYVEGATGNLSIGVRMHHNYFTADRSEYMRAFAAGTSTSRDHDFSYNRVYETNVRDQIESDNTRYTYNIIGPMHLCELSVRTDAEDIANGVQYGNGPCDSVLIANNLFYRTPSCAVFVESAARGTRATNIIANNTIIDCGWGYGTTGGANTRPNLLHTAIHLRNNNGTVPNRQVFYNNLLYNTDGSTPVIWDRHSIFGSLPNARVYSATNWNTTADSDIVTGTIVDNAQLASLVRGYNFIPRPKSPAINAGYALSLSPDFTGMTVPQLSTPDIGPYERATNPSYTPTTPTLVLDSTTTSAAYIRWTNTDTLESEVIVRYSTTAISSANFNTKTKYTPFVLPDSSGKTQTLTVTGLGPAESLYVALKVRRGTDTSTISNIIASKTQAVPFTADTTYLWMDVAAEFVTGKNNTDTLSYVPDSSGDGHPLWQSSAVNKPTYAVNVAGTMPGIKFTRDAVNPTYLTSDSLAPWFRTNDHGFALQMVMKFDSLFGTNYLFSYGNPASTASRYGALYITRSGTTFSWAFEVNTRANPALFRGTIPASDTLNLKTRPFVLTFEWNRDSSTYNTPAGIDTTTDSLRLSFNGHRWSATRVAGVSYDAWDTTLSTSTNGPSRFTFGAKRWGDADPAVNNPSSINLLRALFYRDVPNAVLRSQEATLRTRYGAP